MILASVSTARVLPRFLVFLALLLLAWRAYRGKRHGSAATLAMVASAWVYYFHDINNWLQMLGADSFTETTAPTLSEIRFWLSTMGQVLRPNLRLSLLIAYVAATALVILLIEGLARYGKVSPRYLRRSIGLFAAALIVLSCSSTLWQTVVAFAANSSLEKQVRANFAAPPGLAATAQRKLQVVVYIGESTTMMHWGLYGYPRATTPQLQEIAGHDPGLIVFQNVYSTHTHTSQSLFEALSVAVRKGDELFQITDRRRVSMVDILAAASVPTLLLSNQGKSGTWNMMAPVIFAKARQIYSVEARIAGNMELQIERPFDDVFFGSAQWPLSGVATPAVTFLHSVAGHGPYLEHIPPAYRHNVDGLLDSQETAAIVGSGAGQRQAIEDYDSAMAYVDHAISRQLARVAAWPDPAVLIYFSDHGEAPTDDRGHESSRPLYEMLRVPFLVYFNSAARRGEPQLFARYQALAGSHEIATLAQFPATLFDLLDVQLTGGVAVPLPPVIGAPASPDPILVRKLASGAMAVANLTGFTPQQAAGDVEFSGDPMLRSFVAARALGAGRACAAGTDSFAAARRGSIALGCISVDVMDHEGKLALVAGDAPRPGLALLLKTAEVSGAGVWLHLQHGASGDCTELLALSARDHVAAAALKTVELDGQAPWAPACAQQLNMAGVEVAASLPAEAAAACAAALHKGVAFAADDACRSTAHEIADLRNKGFAGVAVAAIAADAALAAPQALGSKIYLEDAEPDAVAPEFARAARVSFNTQVPNRQ